MADYDDFLDDAGATGHEFTGGEEHFTQDDFTGNDDFGTSNNEVEYINQAPVEEDPFAEAHTGPTASFISDDQAILKRQWEAEHEKQLLEKSKAEDGKRLSKRDAASAELNGWYEQRRVLADKTSSSNRDAEKATLAGLDSDLKSDQSWTRIVNLVDLQGTKDSHIRDITRFKQVLIQLKAHPLQKVL
eukprot:c3466_g1_i1.p1 GENE.c3466_g1_i1~~c3466_g1_i1.p1  ORF type:complete len:188 (-),score=33.14 c3466_g1_i1:105-668(-)